MKPAILQLTKQHVQDSRQYNEGNIAEHLLLNTGSVENGYFFYLTDDEIEEYENSSERRKELEIEVKNWIKKNFDFDFSEFEYL